MSLTIDIENGFDSLNHLFLLLALEKIGNRKNFLKWN